MKTLSKKAEFNFVVLFAIIAGVAILILAVYGATRIGDTKRLQTDTEIAQKFITLTDPLQAGVFEGKAGTITFKQETRVNTFCHDIEFGYNELSVSTSSGVGEEWLEGGERITTRNKYIFSPKQEGKEFTIFSVSLEFPYNIADLIVMVSGEYCFVSPPDKITSILPSIKNINIIEEGNCSEDATRVCFNSGGCDINVYGACMSNCESDYDEGYVEKYGERMYYVDSLVFGAIFSDEELYDCNVKRLMYRAGKIAEIFAEKTDLMNIRDCGSNLKGDLLAYGELISEAEPEEIVQLNQIAKELDKKESTEQCGMW